MLEHFQTPIADSSRFGYIYLRLPNVDRDVHKCRGLLENQGEEIMVQPHSI